MSGIPKTMIAAQQLQLNEDKYHVSEVAVPVPEDDEVLVKTGAATFCHTDLLAREGRFDGVPYIPSHESTGTIVKKGKSVEGFEVGDRIGALSYQHVCMNCPDCRNKSYRYCPNPRGFLGITLDGGFAEYFKSDYRSLVKIPDSMEFIQAAPQLCAGTTMFSAIRRANLPKDAVLGIVGIGGLGHLGIQMARVLGLKVVAIDRRDGPLESVNKFGIAPHLTINSSIGVDQTVKQISTLKSPQDYPGLDAVIVATDNTQAFLYASRITATHGTMVVIGQPNDPIPVKDSELIFRDIRVVGSLLGSTQEAQDCLELVAAHSIKATVHPYKLRDVNQMVSDYLDPDSIGRFGIVF